MIPIDGITELFAILHLKLIDFEEDGGYLFNLVVRNLRRILRRLGECSGNEEANGQGKYDRVLKKSTNHESKYISERKTDGVRTGEYDRMGNRAVYSYFVPLSTPAGRNAGLLQVVRRARDIDEALSALRWIAMGAFGIAVLLMSGIVLWGHRVAIGEPVDQLRRDMTKVEGGSRTHRTTRRGASSTLRSEACRQRWRRLASG